MKQSILVDAYKVIQKLSDQPISMKVGLKLFQLKKQLEPQYEFQLESEDKIFSQYPVQNLKNVGNRTIATFETEQAATEAKELLNELENMEINLDFLPIHISEEDGLSLTLNDIEALSHFVIFELNNTNPESEKNAEPAE